MDRFDEIERLIEEFERKVTEAAERNEQGNKGPEESPTQH